MKICILGRANYDPVRRRAEKLAAKGHEIHVITLHHGSIKNTIVHDHRSPISGPPGYFLSLPFFQQKINEIKPDIIDAHGASSYGLLLIFLKHPIKIITVYGPDIYEHSANNVIIRWIVKKALKKSTIIYGSTSAIDNYIQDIFNEDMSYKTRLKSWGIPYKDIIKNPYERRIEFRKKHGIDLKHKVILHARRFMEFWRVPVIIESVPTVIKRHSEALFIFVYPPPVPSEQVLLNSMIKRVDELNVSNNVKFMGGFAYEEFISCMHASDIFISIGKNDLLAGTLLECMCTATVPVLADLPAYHEVIVNRTNGYLINNISPATVSAQLNEVLDRYEDIQPTIHAINNLLIQEGYDIDVCDEWLIREYEQLIQKRKQPASIE